MHETGRRVEEGLMNRVWEDVGWVWMFVVLLDQGLEEGQYFWEGENVEGERSGI